MDGSRTSAVELEGIVRNLRRLILNAAGKIDELNRELLEIEAAIEILLKTQPTQKPKRASKDTFAKAIYRIIHQSREKETAEGDHADKTRERELTKTILGLTSILTLCHTIFKTRHERICLLRNKRDRILKQSQARRAVAQVPEPLEKDAEQILPPEIWKILINQVEAPDDLWSCSNTCFLFNKVLEPSKPEWMFGLVLPYLSGHLSFTDVLTCRLVNKSWRNAIDHFDWHSYYATSPGIKTAITTRIQNWGDLDLIHQKKDAYKKQNENPFPARSLSIDDVGFRFLPIGTVFRDLLSWSGTHISTFTYTTNNWAGYENNFPQVVSQLLSLRDCLGQLPNLRHLALLGELDVDAIEPQDAEIDWEIKLERFPFPEMPCLQSLEITRVTHEPEWLILIRKYSGQLVKLSLFLECWYFSELNPTMPSFQFPQLKELTVDQFQGYTAFLRWIDAPRLEKFVVSGLSDGFGEDGDEDDQSVPELLFSILHRFPTLRHLYPCIPKRLGGTLGHVARLNADWYAPKTLETLEFDVFENISLSVLLKFPYLQHLHLYQTSGADKEEHAEFQKNKSGQMEVVEFYKYYPGVFAGDKAIYKSNIWRILPFLKTLTCYAFNDKNKFVYRREAFEK